MLKEAPASEGAVAAWEEAQNAWQSPTKLFPKNCCKLSPYCILPNGHWKKCHKIKPGLKVILPNNGIGVLFECRKKRIEKPIYIKNNNYFNIVKFAINRYWLDVFPLKDPPELHENSFKLIKKIPTFYLQGKLFSYQLP